MENLLQLLESLPKELVTGVVLSYLASLLLLIPVFIVYKGFQKYKKIPSKPLKDSLLKSLLLLMTLAYGVYSFFLIILVPTGLSCFGCCGKVVPDLANIIFILTAGFAEFTIIQKVIKQIKEGGTNFKTPLLLVLSLALLSSILFSIIFLLSPAPSCGRKLDPDDAIKSDIGQVSIAIEIYYTDHGIYPEELDDLRETGYLKTIPKSPSREKYKYIIANDGKKAVIYYPLTNPVNASSPLWAYFSNKLAEEASEKEILKYVK